ncbi:Uncharacterised protein [Bordetella pertussis]|nr:Uncharacterised protein [Bordetella pertussis]
MSSRRFFSPWNRPQSTSRRVSPWRSRCLDPVTVPAPPRQVSVSMVASSEWPRRQAGHPDYGSDGPGR